MLSTRALVYFMQSILGGPIKIGSTRSLFERLLSCQLGCPVHLRVVGVIPGDESLELQLRRRFRKFMRPGGWFDPAPGLISLIQSCGGSAIADVSQLLSVGVVQRFTIGASELGAWCKLQPKPLKEVARTWGTAPWRIRRYIDGKSLPTGRWTARIEPATQVPAWTWAFEVDQYDIAKGLARLTGERLITAPCASADDAPSIRVQSMSA